jgi:hypothetical protein
MGRIKLVNNIEIPLTPEEEKARDEEEAQAKLNAETLSRVKYRDDRKMAYPEIGDQLDDLYKKGAFSDEMSAVLAKVKADNPKP